MRRGALDDASPVLTRVLSRRTLAEGEERAERHALTLAALSGHHVVVIPHEGVRGVHEGESGSEGLSVRHGCVCAFLRVLQGL